MATHYTVHRGSDIDSGLARFRRGRYRDYYFMVLKHLATLNPIVRVKDLRSKYRIPPASLSEVLRELKNDGLVETHRSFPDRMVVKITEKGKQEYHRSISKAPTFRLTSAVEGYLKLRGLSHDSLFPIQRKFVERGLLYSHANAAIFGYPGTGKTLVAEMAMANELADGGNVLYCTPYRALDWQKYQEFQSTFRGMKKSVVISDGDNPLWNERLNEADVVVATFERVQAALRRNESWLDRITLACVDELTLLGEKVRGGTLDVVLSSLKGKRERRLITLSSLVGNSLEISDWLGAEPIIEVSPSQDVKEHLAYKAKDSIVFLRKDGKKSVVDSTDDPVHHIVKDNLSRGLTTLVFVGTRPDTKRLAKELASFHVEQPDLVREARTFLESSVIENTELTRQLCALIEKGVAFHQAGLQRSARRLVEDLLKTGKLRTIVATTTLSHGVDYKIDSVVIDLPGIIKIRELQGYEYLNLMGRTGRPGLSTEANVFIKVEPRKVKQAVRKYLYGSPEEVFPPNTFDKENLAQTILHAASGRTLMEREILQPLRGTFSSLRKKPSKRLVKAVIQELVSLGLIAVNENQVAITDLGKRVLAANLSPHDAELVLRLEGNPTDQRILDLASNIDLAKRVREEPRLRNKSVVGILRAFIREVPIDEIRRRFGLFLDDQDVIELAEYTARSLRKMADLLTEPSLKKRIEILQNRTKLGSRPDLAASELIKLSILTKNKNRLVARKLMDSGLDRLETIASATPSALATTLGVSEGTVERLIQEASSIRASEA